ncbi:hypothetical protein Tco_0997442 [Tanacetum coccineum]
MGGSFHTSPPRSTQAPPAGTTSDGAKDLDKLTTLSSLVSTLVQKVNTHESELKAHKLLFKEVVGKLVKRVKLLEDKLKGRKRKFVLTDSDKEEDVELDVDPLIKLAKAAATAAAASAVPIGGSHEADILPSSSIPTDEFAGGSDVPAGATTGPSTVSPSSTTVPTPSSVPAADTIPAGSGTTPESPSSPVRDARKGKGVAVNEPTPTQDKTFKQLEEERLARQMSQDFEMTDDDTPVNVYVVVDWELVPTGLGLINVFYRKDNSRKYFTSLREILHLVTRADLMTIYGRVMTFYKDKKAAGIGLVLWGDLKVLMDSPEVNDGSDVWKNQQTWKIQSWKLYSYSGVHVLETVSGLVVHMFDHQLEICHGIVGNELTTAVKLIAFLKKQISDSRRPKVHDWYC